MHSGKTKTEEYSFMFCYHFINLKRKLKYFFVYKLKTFSARVFVLNTNRSIQSSEMGIFLD